MPVKVTIRAELQDAEAGPEVQKIGLSFKSLPPEPVVVQTVAPATWGSDRGIQGGQQIVAINGLDVATMTQQEFRAALKARPLTLRFRISDDPEEEPLQAAVASSDVDKLGMSFQSLPPEPVIVNKVAAGGWAESVGFLGGEEILVVNGESTVAMSSEDFKAALRVRPLVLRFQQPAEEEDEQDDLVQEVEVGPEVSKIGLSFHNLPPEPVVVNKVAAGTWAESVGFIGGEEILALNDEDVASMTSERFKSVLKSRPLLIRFQASEFEEVEAGEEVLKIGLSFKALPPEPLVVSKVAPGSWAATVGFQGGEEIAAINGLAVADMSNEDFKALLRARPLTLRIVSSTVAAADPPAGQTDKDARDKQQAQAATKIQAIHRGNLARKEGQAKRKKKAAKEAKEGEAATKIQAIHRGNLARKEAQSQKEEEEDGRSKQPEKAAKEAQGKQEEEAATKIQAIHRGNLARKDGRSKQQEKAAKEAQSKQEEEAATKIQAIHRGNLARKDGRSKQPEKAAKEAQSKQEEEAATKIQAIHRGNLARKDGRRKQPEKAAKAAQSKTEEEAATKIQAIHRGNLARKEGRSSEKQTAAEQATPRHLTVESVSTAACRADVAAAAADRLYSQAQKRKERQRKKKDAEDGLQAIKEKKEKEVKLTKERQNDLVLRLHNYGQEKQKEAMEKREEARKAAEEEVRQLADRRRGKSNKVRPETFFRLHLDGLQREEALAERRKMKEMEEEHRLKAESIHCGAAPNPDVFHMLHASYNAKQGRVVNKTLEAEEAEAEAASDEGSEHFDTEVEQANLDLSAWKLSQGPRSPDDGGGEDGPDPRSREPSDRRKSNEEDRASTLQELREVRRSRLAMHDWMETQKRELKAGDDRFRTPPGASIAPAERPADSPSLEGGPEGDERALQALLQRRPGSVPGGKRRSVAATLLSKELFGSDDEKDEPLPSQSSHDADPLWGAVSDIVSWKRKDEAT